MTLQGEPQLRRRLKAIKTFPKSKTLPSAWQLATTAVARSMVPVRTGRTRESLRPGQKRGKAAVVGFYTVNFIDAGSKAHVEPRQPGLTKTGRVSKRRRGSGKVLMFSTGGGTVFRKKVNKPAIHARPFKKESGERGLELVQWQNFLISLWNNAA